MTKYIISSDYHCFDKSHTNISPDMITEKGRFKLKIILTSGCVCMAGNMRQEVKEILMLCIKVNIMC